MGKDLPLASKDLPLASKDLPLASKVLPLVSEEFPSKIIKIFFHKIVCSETLNRFMKRIGLMDYFSNKNCLKLS